MLSSRPRVITIILADLRLLLCLIVIGSLSSCKNAIDLIDDNESNRESTLDQPHLISLRFTLDEDTKSQVIQGLALGVTIRETESRQIVRHEWINYLIERSVDDADLSGQVSDPSSLDAHDSDHITSLRTLTPLELYESSYELRFYLKRGELNLTSHAGSPEETVCPIPISPRSPLIAQDVDPSFGRWRGVIQRDQTLEVNLTSQTCGPGDLNTQLSGTLSLPSALSTTAQDRLMLHLKPESLDIEDEGRNLPSRSITFPLAPHLRPLDEIGVFSFSLNQIPEGTFSVQVFVDSDGDYLPTPCDLELRRGGDRWVAVHDNPLRKITRGEREFMSTPWILNPVSTCDLLQISPIADDEIVVTSDLASKSAVFLGQLNLTPEVLSALAFSPSKKVWFSTRRRALPPTRFIEAQELFSLNDAIIADGRFSVHLSQSATYEPLEFAVWIDEGYDGALTPCDDPANRGADVWWWEGDSESLSALLSFDLSQPPPLTSLNISQRCEAPESLIEVEFDLNFTWPESISTRPLVLVYQDLVSGEIWESVITDLNQEQALDYEENPKRTRVQLSPGSYLLSAYIDQDFDQRFIPCNDQSLGDRFSTARGEFINLSSSEIITAVLSLTPRECPYLESQLLTSLISGLTDLPLVTSEVSEEPLDLGEFSCQSREVSLHLTDINPLDLSLIESSSDNLSSNYCISVNQLPHSLDLLPAGYYQLSACALMSTSAIERALSEVPPGSTPTPWGDCIAPRYWWTSSDVHLTLSEVQSVELKLTPSCTCD